MTITSFSQAREDDVARVDRRRAEERGQLLRDVARGQPGVDRHGVVAAERQPAPADLQQLLQLLRGAVHREQLHWPRQEIDTHTHTHWSNPKVMLVSTPCTVRGAL